MKKYIVILVLTFLGYGSEAQKAPIAPRKPNNGEYSLSEAEQFVQKGGKVSDWWRSNALSIINRDLTSAGETVRVDESNIHWIFLHISYEFKDLDPYTNSRLSAGIPEWFDDKDGWSGDVAVFRYGNCTIILYKVGCMNLLNIQPKVVDVPKYQPSTQTVPAISTPQPTVINNYNNCSCTSPTSSGDYVVGNSGYSGYSEPIYPTQGYYSTGNSFGVRVNLNIGSRGGYQQRGYQRDYYQPQRSYQPQRQYQTRTMSRGISGGSNPGGGGVSGVVRGMSGGVRGR